MKVKHTSSEINLMLKINENWEYVIGDRNKPMPFSSDNHASDYARKIISDYKPRYITGYAVVNDKKYEVIQE